MQAKPPPEASVSNMGVGPSPCSPIKLGKELQAHWRFNENMKGDCDTLNIIPSQIPYYIKTMDAICYARKNVDLKEEGYLEVWLHEMS